MKNHNGTLLLNNTQGYLLKSSLVRDYVVLRMEGDEAAADDMICGAMREGKLWESAGFTSRYGSIDDPMTGALTLDFKEYQRVGI